MKRQLHRYVDTLAHLPVWVLARRLMTDEALRQGPPPPPGMGPPDPSARRTSYGHLVLEHPVVLGEVAGHRDRPIARLCGLAQAAIEDLMHGRLALWLDARHTVHPDRLVAPSWPIPDDHELLFGGAAIRALLLSTRNQELLKLFRDADAAPASTLVVSTAPLTPDTIIGDETREARRLLMEWNTYAGQLAAAKAAAVDRARAVASLQSAFDHYYACLRWDFHGGRRDPCPDHLRGVEFQGGTVECWMPRDDALVLAPGARHQFEGCPAGSSFRLPPARIVDVRAHGHSLILRGDFSGPGLPSTLNVRPVHPDEAQALAARLQETLLLPRTPLALSPEQFKVLTCPAYVRVRGQVRVSRGFESGATTLLGASVAWVQEPFMMQDPDCGVEGGSIELCDGVEYTVCGFYIPGPTAVTHRPAMPKLRLVGAWRAD